MALVEPAVSVEHGLAAATERPRVHVLDGLRGVAVLLVLAFHFTWNPTGGWLGVDLFFVLSGYLITSTLLEDMDRFAGGRFTPAHARRFYIGRVLRILPALLEMCALFGAIALMNPEHTTRFWANVQPTLLLYSNWRRAFHLEFPDYLGHTWSLAIEEQFYLVWPLVLLVFLRVPRRERVLGGFLAIAIAAVAVLRFVRVGDHPDIDRLYNGTDTRIDTILMGCLSAIVSRAGGIHRALLRHGRVFGTTAALAAALAGWMFWVTNFQDPWFYRYGMLLFSLTCAVLITYVCLFPSTIIAFALRLRPLTYIGKRSYAIYLFHFPIFMGLYFIHKQTQGWTMAFEAGVPTLLLAALSWRYVEHPALQLRKRWVMPRQTVAAN